MTDQATTPAEWAERYLTAKREGSHVEANDIYHDAIQELDSPGVREFAELIEEK